jgi:TRAP transporter 4TM/12TM fusion protein
MNTASVQHYTTVVFAALCVYYHIHLIFTGLIPNLISRPIHLALALPWVFIIGARGNRLTRFSGYFLCVFGVCGCAYVALNRDQLVEQYGFIEGVLQYVIGVGLILAVLEMARRAIKLALPIVAVIALLYGLFGQYLPGEFGHGGIPIGSLLGTLVIAEGGLWGPLTGVSVNVVAIFVIMGAFISAGEGGAGFMALATKLAGRFRAGAAKVSVLSSAFFGSISGSASANVASTGAVTLPAMKRLGYPASFAAAVEAVASSGGQIMPPLMGAGAFVMMELLQVDYTHIMAAALLPAVLFFFAVWVGVDLFARRHGLRTMTADEIPTGRDVARLAPFFLIPFSILLLTLFLTGYTAQFAAGLAIFSSAALLIIDDKLKISIPRMMTRLSQAFVAAAAQIAMIASIIICAGLVIGVLNMTGLGVKITSIILGMAGGQLWVALLLTALACLILGMEVPTTAAYVICVSVAGPALVDLGLQPLSAHLFIFWYALLSTITPPVCGTVFIAAGMAETGWMPVAGQAMRLGLGLYFVPLAFIANPDLILLETKPVLACLTFVKVAVGLWLLSKSMIGGASIPLKLLLFCGGVLTIFLFGIGRF